MKGGAILITLNTEHSAYDRLVDVLERDSTEEDSQEKLAERLNNALEGLKLLPFLSSAPVHAKNG